MEASDLLDSSGSTQDEGAINSLDEDVVLLKAEWPHSLNFMHKTIVLKLLFPESLWEWA